MYGSQSYLFRIIQLSLHTYIRTLFSHQNHPQPPIQTIFSYERITNRSHTSRTTLSKESIPFVNYTHKHYSLTNIMQKLRLQPIICPRHTLNRPHRSRRLLIQHLP